MIRIKKASTQIATLLACLIVNLPAQTVVHQGKTRLSSDFAGSRVPVWTNGVLTLVEKNDTTTPVIHLFDETGIELSPMAFSIPDANATRVERLARGNDGAYAVVGSSFDQAGHGGGFVAWISPDRRVVKIVRPYPYVPNLVTIAADGTIWTQGAEMVNGVENHPDVNRNHGVIRHFDTNGEQIGEFLPRTSLFDGKWMGLPQGMLASNGDRLGWYARVAKQYFEMTFDGKVTNYGGVVPTNSKQIPATLVITDSGEAVVSLLANDYSTALYRLDRAAGRWLPLDLPGPDENKPRLLLLGGDGNRLVFGDGSADLQRYTINK
jgi:hypothetical protein